MKLTELYGNIRKHLYQTASPITNNALYFNAFGFQAAYCCEILFVGFVFDFADG